jgi:hypothetical protein
VLSSTNNDATPSERSHIGLIVGLSYMTMRSIALSVHILGVIALFVVMAQEWLTVNLLRASDARLLPSAPVAVLTALPRLTGIAAAAILVSGIYLAAHVGVLRSGWVDVSFGTMVLMATLGASSLRPLLRALKNSPSSIDTMSVRRHALRPFVRGSLRIRLSVAVAIVYLMVAKPDLLEAGVIMIGGLAIGGAAALARRDVAVEGPDRAPAAGR